MIITNTLLKLVPVWLNIHFKNLKLLDYKYYNGIIFLIVVSGNFGPAVARPVGPVPTPCSIITSLLYACTHMVTLSSLCGKSISSHRNIVYMR